ncbi:acyltransferase [Desulfomicrobium sp. ZS1]|uniref:acyltransferase n=1 Tax=Desulfomicrobium sp. ZS1 TaxID=2952228 RepID=UPI0020B343E5|nr:acyltransferase [Desulfomicrobium sp. ZS1]UTF50711.1 acyltransferase [Desulfomicrobium sp. ZS1]
MALSWHELSVKIRRRETPFYERLYTLAKEVHGISFPMNKTLHGFLYREWVLRTSLWHEFWRVVYYEPMFKSQCVSVGANFKMHYAGNGSTKILGDLQIHIGSNVTMFDNVAFAGLKVLDKPELYIGDNTYIGPQVKFRVGRKVAIGKYCMIVSPFIADNPGHQIDDMMARMQSGGGCPKSESIRPVIVGDFCWLTLETAIYPGTVVGDGVVAKLGTHLSRTVPPFCLISGNPWKVERKLPIPEELKEIVGPERYESYLEAHREVDAGKYPVHGKSDRC